MKNVTVQLNDGTILTGKVQRTWVERSGEDERELIITHEVVDQNGLMFVVDIKDDDV